jgi:hypothetical protein
MSNIEPAKPEAIQALLEAAFGVARANNPQAREIIAGFFSRKFFPMGNRRYSVKSRVECYRLADELLRDLHRCGFRIE